MFLKTHVNIIIYHEWVDSSHYKEILALIIQERWFFRRGFSFLLNYWTFKLCQSLLTIFLNNCDLILLIQKISTIYTVIFQGSQRNPQLGITEVPPDILGSSESRDPVCQTWRYSVDLLVVSRVHDAILIAASN
jgi:hypothetical protein